GARLQQPDVALMELRVRAPVLDGANGGNLLQDLEKRGRRVALPSRERILKQDERQVRRIGDALEVRERHLRALAEGVDRGREDEQRRGAALRGHLRETSGLEAA